MAKPTQAKGRTVPTPPVEPVLEMDDIQGIAIPGFFKPRQTLLYVGLGSDPTALDKLKRFLAGFTPSTATETLADRRANRTGERKTKDRTLRAVGLSFRGLQRLVPGAAGIASPAFRLGQVARSAMLGDPTDPDAAGNPANWIVGGAGAELDLIFVFVGDSRDEVSEAAAKTARDLRGLGLSVSSEDGGIRTDLPGHEHFGFDDGVSQPGIRGRASAATGDFITPRTVDPRVSPYEAMLYGYPGQALVWPGEFVLGYPASGPDPLRAGPVANPGPVWARNGSFLVFRRLRQDVAAFWNFIATTREKTPDLKKTISDDIALASMLVGRWPSGAPFVRTPRGDNKPMGDNKYENNNFLFAADTPDIAYIDKHGKSHGTIFRRAMAKADPIGVVCPWAAHIRKINTRDSPSDMGAAAATQTRRLLRVGVPYGPPIENNYKDDGVDRGLLFLSIQASIDDQFEFLQARWMNDPTRPKAPAGNDMLVGQNAAADFGVRSCVMFPPGQLVAVALKTDKQWVVPTGGGYFFLPSLSALRHTIGRGGVTARPLPRANSNARS